MVMSKLETYKGKIMTNNHPQKENIIVKIKSTINDHPFAASILASIIATLIINLANIFSLPTIINVRLDALEKTLNANMEAELTSIKSELNESIIESKNETNEKLSTVSNELTNKIYELNIDLNNKITDTNNDMYQEFTDIRKEIADIRKEISNINSKVNYYSNLEFDPSFSEAITATFQNVDTIGYVIPLTYQWDSEDKIADDVKNNIEYFANQLTDTKLLIPYFDGNKEIFFYGQYNASNHWNGNCIINIYEENKLTTIIEGNYDDGKLLSYKNAVQTTTAAGIEVWSFSYRTNEITYNSGETRNYYKLNNYEKTFNNVSIENILYVDNFENSIKISSPLEGYYFGNTSNGFYNDNTGKAYMIKYDIDGIIKAFYTGCFKDGFLDDNSGNAWEIIFDNSNNINKYFYYRGKFQKGKREDDAGIRYIDQNEINEKISGMQINSALNWYNTNNSNI